MIRSGQLTMSVIIGGIFNKVGHLLHVSLRPGRGGLLPAFISSGVRDGRGPPPAPPLALPCCKRKEQATPRGKSKAIPCTRLHDLK